MKVLWVTDIAQTPASRLLGDPVNPFGGWLQGSLRALASLPEVKVTVAFPGTDSVRELGTVDGTSYIGFPAIERRVAKGRRREIAAQVIAASAHDLVHIHGTRAASFVVLPDSGQGAVGPGGGIDPKDWFP